MDTKMSNSKILISGASGFVGSHLIDALVAEGHHIIALHNRPLDVSRQHNRSDLIEWVQFDITSDDISHVCQDVDIVFHLAAYSTVEETEREIAKLNEINILGTKSFAKSCKKCGVRQFIFVSSISACEYSVANEVDERNGYPQSAYGKSKLEAENLVLAMTGNGFEVTVLRPTALFGENHLGSVYELVKAIKHKRFVIFGQGKNHTNFYYIKDFVTMMMSVASNSDAYGQVYIASDKPLSLDELSSYILEALGMKFKIPKVPFVVGYWIAGFLDLFSKWLDVPLSRRRLRAMTRDTIYSNKKMEKTLGLHPIYGVKSGLENTINWYKSQGLL